MLQLANSKKVFSLCLNVRALAIWHSWCAMDKYSIFKFFVKTFWTSYYFFRWTLDIGQLVRRLMYRPSSVTLNPGSALNPRTLNPGTTVFSHRAKICHDCFTNSNLRGNMTDFTKHFSASRMCRYIQIYILVIVSFKSTGKLSWIEPKMVMSHPSVMLHTIAMAC